MLRFLLLLALLFAAAHAYATGILSYSPGSELIEYQGRALARTIRWFLLSGVPAQIIIGFALTLLMLFTCIGTR